MRKFKEFILIFLWMLGSIGGVGYALYNDAWPIAVGIVVVAWMSWPELADYFKDLMD